MAIRNPQCKLCSLHETTKKVCVLGNGPAPAKIMIIGEAPGREEENTGKPFQGRAGKLLSELLKTQGIKRNDCYVTNAVHCRPPENRTPTKPELKACRFYLDQEIKAVNPEFVLLLGATALNSVLGKSKVMDLRGSSFQKDGRTYFVTVHPAAALRSPKFQPFLESDIKRFARLIRGENLDEDGVDIDWVFVDTMAKLKKCLRDVDMADAISYDYETSSLDQLGADEYIMCKGIATDNKCWVIPLTYPGSPFMGESVQQKIHDALDRVTVGKKLIAQNGKFDNKWAKVFYGWDIPQTFDTMLAAHLLNENGIIDLKRMAMMYFNAPDYDLKKPIDPTSVPIQKLCKYCAYDVYYTLKLYHKFRKELMEDKRLLRVYKKLTIPLSKTLEDMELQGVYIHPEKFITVKEQLQGEINQLRAKLNKLSKGKVANWGSTQQVANFLYGDLKLPILEKTAKGKPSTSGESVLPRLVDHHPVVQVLLDHREKIKLMQFLDSWEDHMDENNMIHPNFKIHGTVTGRLSCVEPNLQQVPRESNLRTIIDAPPGWTLIEADYSQAELRIAAMLANEKNMKMAYQSGQDIHTITASNVMGIPLEKVAKDDRKKAKAVNFGFVYGMSAKKFRIYARDKYGVKLTEEEAVLFRKRFFDGYPDLLSWHERQRRLVRKYGYVRSPIGRVRHLPEINSEEQGVRAEAERQAINSPVQGLGSDLCAYSITRLHRLLPKEIYRPVGLVHDATLQICRKGTEEFIASVIKYIMEDMDTVEKEFNCEFTVPIIADVKIGPWGGGTEWNGKKHLPTEQELEELVEKYGEVE